MFKHKRILSMLALLCMGTALLSAQTVNKSFRNQSLKTVLKDIELQTGLSVIYNTDEVDDAQKVTASFNNTPVKEALASILDESLNTEIQNKMIVITKKKASPASSDKTKTINGVVIDANGEPIIGAGVIVKGSNNGAITDANGRFSLSVRGG